MAAEYVLRPGDSIANPSDLSPIPVLRNCLGHRYLLVTLAVVAEIDRRRGKLPPFLDYLNSDFDREHPQQDFFTEPDEWNADNRLRMKSLEARENSPPEGNWD